MIGLFTRLRARRDVHEAEPDERRTTLAEIEALLREIAAKPAEIDWTPNTSDSLGGEAFAARLRLAS